MEGFICVNLNSNQAVSLKNVFRGQDPTVVPVYVINREQNNFLHIAYWLFFSVQSREAGPALGFFCGVVALGDIQHLDTRLETGRK